MLILSKLGQFQRHTYMQSNLTDAIHKFQPMSEQDLKCLWFIPKVSVFFVCLRLCRENKLRLRNVTTSRIKLF